MQRHPHAAASERVNGRGPPDRVCERSEDLDLAVAIPRRCSRVCQGISEPDLPSDELLPGPDLHHRCPARTARGSSRSAYNLLPFPIPLVDHPGATSVARKGGSRWNNS